MDSITLVIPAFAGIQSRQSPVTLQVRSPYRKWIPAFAGMTGFQRPNCVSPILIQTGTGRPQFFRNTAGISETLSYGPYLVILPAWDIPSSMTLVAGMLPMEP